MAVAVEEQGALGASVRQDGRHVRASPRRAMPFDVAGAFAARSGENFALHERYLNRQLARTLKTIGFDREYVRGEGCYLYDAAGQRYLDFLSGFGVYALGRSHP